MKITDKYIQRTHRPDCIDVIRVVFHSLPDLILSTGQWADIGGYRGVLKNMCLCIKDIKGVYLDRIPAIEFSMLGDWEA